MFVNKTTIFFDLDHTLWDYERNCDEALSEIFEEFELQKFGIYTSNVFITAFHKVNNRLWDLYDTRKITSDELRKRRFVEIFEQFNIVDNTLFEAMHLAYMAKSPNKPYLMPGAMEILQYLKPKYSLHIITNGLADIQGSKMRASGILNFFDTFTCSEKANARKPEKEIFEYALNNANTTANQSVMIGDNKLADIGGAINAKMDYVYYTPQVLELDKNEKFRIKHLLELKQFL